MNTFSENHSEEYCGNVEHIIVEVEHNSKAMDILDIIF